MIKEFKEFAIRGNVVDMAVGIIIGGAFTGVVKTMVDEVVMPPLGLLTGRVDFKDKFLLLKSGKVPAPYETLKDAKDAGAVVVAYGSLFNSILSLMIVALVLFFLVRWINHLKAHEAPPPPPSTKPCPFCKTSVNLDASRCPACTSQLEGTTATP
jgi:large conductance mechanosensitive channel